LKAILANFAGATRCTIEDYMSELVDLIAVAERRKQRSATVPGFALGAETYSSDQLATALDDIKRAIAASISAPGVHREIETHRRFVRTIHGILRSGKGSAPTTAVEYL